MENLGTPYPKTWDKCPVCGCTDTIANSVLQEEKDKGKIGKEAKAYISQTQSLIADMTKAFLTAPVITAYYDICVDCGIVYCVHVEVVQASPQMTQLKPGQQGPGGIYKG